MDALPPEVFSQILCCLDAPDVASLMVSSPELHRFGKATQCVADAFTFRLAASSHERYTDHFVLQHCVGSTGGVTFQDGVVRQPRISRRMILQLLVLNNEMAAALWLARHGNMKVPRRSSCSLSLLKDLPWDFRLYATVCQALQTSTRATVHLHIRSLPGMVRECERLLMSPQTFLCSLLSYVRDKTVALHLCGKAHDLPHQTVSESSMEAERRKLDDLLGDHTKVWTDGIRVYSHHDFRSSTVGIGTVLMAVRPLIKALDLQNYVFDEVHPGLDALLVRSWLDVGVGQTLVRARLQHVSFTSGGDFCDILRALCRVPTLESLRLSCIEYWTEAPDDPMRVIFQECTPRLQDVRMNNVMRTQGEFPFDALVSGYRNLGLSRMFLDSMAVHNLSTKMLPHLVSLDLSWNGIDGACLGMFAKVLASPECKLTRLNLKSNVITSAFVVLFCDGLSRNKTLAHLDLSDNFLGTQSVQLLLKTLLGRSNTTLQCLHLDCNQVRLTMDDLYRLLLSSPPRVPPFFRQVSLRDNPIDVGTATVEDKRKYHRFFSDTFGVSFQF